MRKGQGLTQGCMAQAVPETAFTGGWCVLQEKRFRKKISFGEKKGLKLQLPGLG